MTVSLLIGCEGNIGNRAGFLGKWLHGHSLRQRLAGGTVLKIGGLEFFGIDDGQNKKNLSMLIRKLLPGFILQDRSEYLKDHIEELWQENEGAELFDAWLDFIALKQKARPVSERISRHLVKQTERYPEDKAYRHLLSVWQEHLKTAYEQTTVPELLKNYFGSMTENNANKKLLAQWKGYCAPNKKTAADWEYIPKPKQGFLVPIMVGYKAISNVYKNKEVANARDDETDVCFVEAVHSIGEWQGVHRIRDEEALKQSLWQYDYQKHWYLCKQILSELNHRGSEIYHEDPDDFS